MAFLCLNKVYISGKQTYFLREERIAHMLSMVPAMFMVSELFSISSFKAFYRYLKAVLYCCFLNYY